MHRVGVEGRWDDDHLLWRAERPPYPREADDERAPGAESPNDRSVMTTMRRSGTGGNLGACRTPEEAS